MGYIFSTCSPSCHDNFLGKGSSPTFVNSRIAFLNSERSRNTIGVAQQLANSAWFDIARWKGVRLGFLLTSFMIQALKALTGEFRIEEIEQ